MKHLLDTRELTREEAIEILDVADYMAQVKAENRTLNVLNGKTVVNLFFEDSTRTPPLLRSRREAPGRRRHQLLRIWLLPV